ncbi:MAG: thioesterase family protein [Cyanobacteria bacterium P01_F01_bin.3]
MTFKIDIRVRFSETDLTGAVYHANYLLYFEEARNNAFRKIGILYDELEKVDRMIAITSASQTYKSPAFYDDLLTVYTWLRKINAYIAIFEYQILRTKTEIATGRTELIFLEKSRDFIPRRIPRELIDKAKEFVETP